MTTKEQLEIDTWIEINVFGKHLVSEMRGEYEWFYFVDSDGKLGHQDKSKCAKRDWSEFNPMKHILPDSQPRRFTTNSAASMELLKECAKEKYGMFPSIVVRRDDGLWFVECDDSPFMEYENSETLELAIALFSIKFFSK